MLSEDLGLQARLYKPDIIASTLADEQLTPKDCEQHIRRLEDSLVDRFFDLREDSNAMQDAKRLFSCFGSMEDRARMRLLTVIFASLAKSSKELSMEHLTAVECSLILGYAATQAAEQAVLANLQMESNRKKKGADKSFDWSALHEGLLSNLGSIINALGSGKMRMEMSSVQREELVGVAVRTGRILLENRQAVKKGLLKNLGAELLAAAGASNVGGWSRGLQMLIEQDILYDGEQQLLTIDLDAVVLLVERYDDKSLIEKLLEQLGRERGVAKDDSQAVRNIVLLLGIMREKLPRELQRSLMHLGDLLDCDSWQLRVATLEVIAAIIRLHGKTEDEDANASTETLLSRLEERLLDSHGLVRAKVLQVGTELILLQTVGLSALQRTKWLSMAVGRLQDKGSMVRRRALQLVGAVLRSHPFVVDGGELKGSLFHERLVELDRCLQERAASTTEGEDLMAMVVQRRYYADAVAFVKQLDQAMAVMDRLLRTGLAQGGELTELMDLATDAALYRLESSGPVIRQMLHLVWEETSKPVEKEEEEEEQSGNLKSHLLACFHRLYLLGSLKSSNQRERLATIVTNLLALIAANIQEPAVLASIEAILQIISSHEDLLPSAVPGLLVNYLEQEEEAMVLLSMLAGSKRLHSFFLEKLSVIVRFGLHVSSPLRVEHCCLILQRSLYPARLPMDHEILKKLVMLVHTAPVTAKWLQATAVILRTVYQLAEQPDVLAVALLRWNNPSTSLSLCRLVFMVGQLAVLQAEHLTLVEAHLKGQQSIDEEGIANLMGTAREKELLGEESFLSGFVPMVRSLALKALEPYPSPSFALLYSTAALCLAKLMTVSHSLCEKELPLYLTLLARSSDQAVRANLTIAFADLCHAHGHLAEANLPYLFGQLGDQSTLVRRHGLLVITHLALSGQIKASGQYGRLARMLLDSDAQVRSLARMFFHELAASRDRQQLVCTQLLPEIISTLRHNEEEGEEALSSEDFTRIVAFLFAFVKKEKQMETLVERLCHRFRQCDPTEPQQARDLAYCLSQISYSSEKTLQKLLEALPLYQSHLISDEATCKIFADIIQKMRRSVSRPELKPLVDQFERLLIEATSEDDGGIAPKLKQLALDVTQTRKKKNVSKKEKIREESEDAIHSGDDELVTHRSSIRSKRAAAINASKNLFNIEA